MSVMAPKPVAIIAALKGNSGSFVDVDYEPYVSVLCYTYVESVCLRLNLYSFLT